MRKFTIGTLVIVVAILVVIHFFPLSEKNTRSLEQTGEQITKVEDKAKSAAEEGGKVALNVFDKLTSLVGFKREAGEDNPEDKADSSEAEAFKLLYVIDGDTIMVDNQGTEMKVRLIGLDTPESVHEDESKNNEYGVMASEHTKELLKNIETVYLSYDKEFSDKYGRVLAYVWIKPVDDMTSIDLIRDNMLNYIILSDGYAVNKVYAPNDMYADYFEIARTEAEKNEQGLWQYDGYKALVK